MRENLKHQLKKKKQQKTEKRSRNRLIPMLFNTL